MFPFIIFLVSFVFVFQVSNAHALVRPRATTIDCPPSRLQSGRKCIPFVENKEIAGISFSLYAWTKPDGSGSPTADTEYLESLQSAAAKVLPVLAPLMREKPKVIRAYVTEDLKDRGMTDTTDSDRSLCSLRVIGPGDDATTRDILSAQKTLAHELYHCVQRSYPESPMREDPIDKPNNWWVEGSAEYFGNVFFPGAKQSHMSTYNPREQLFRQRTSNGYAASLFWLHLSNTFTPDIAIHNYVIGRRDFPSDTAQEEQKLLSTDNFIAKAFPSFATQYLEGKIVFHLKDSDTVLTVPNSFREKVRARKNTIEPRPGVYSVVTSVLSWGIWETYALTFPSGRLVSFTWQPDDPQDSETVLQYRKSTETTWKRVGKGEKVTVDDCGSQYVFFGTSTRDTDVSKTFPVTITITVKEKPKKPKKRDENPAQNDSPAENRTDITVPPDTPEGVTIISVDDSESDDNEEAGSCSANKCIIGKWNLDLSNMQAYLSKTLAGTHDGISISNVAVSGSMSFSIDDALLSSMVFKNLALSYDGSVPDVAGSSFHTIIDMTGSVTGPVSLSGDDSFTWVNPVSEGTVKTTSTAAVLGAPMVMDFPVSQQYGPDTQVQYTCQGDSLDMAGYAEGQYQWGYTWTREVIV